MHKDESEKEAITENGHNCEKCDFSCFTSNGLAKHMKMRHVGKSKVKLSLKCSFCERIFHERCKLRAHEKYHTKSLDYCCEFCGKRHAQRYQLQLHLLTHKEKIIPCDKCDLLFKSPIGLRAHRKLIHPKEPFQLFQCEFCPQKFRSKIKFDDHSLSHITGRERFPCIYCDKTFSRKDALKNHVRHHTNDLFQCHLCDKGFSRRHALKSHLFSHTETRPHKCPDCPKSFKHTAALHNHARYQHSPNPHDFKCQHCGEVFTSFYRRQAHIRDMHQDIISVKKRYACEVCHKTFSDRSYVKYHMKTHSGIRDFKCTVAGCNKAFTLKTGLDQHHVNHSDIKAFTCDVCGRAYKRPSGLRSHMGTHSDEPPSFACEVCGKLFRQLKHVKAHIAIHSDERSHVCDICDKRFARPESLWKHRKLHDESRLHKCPKCPKSFQMNHWLQMHMKIHLGIKDVQCPLCDFRTTSANRLHNHHLYVHSNLKPFVCECCGKAFAFKSDRKKHYRVHIRSGEMQPLPESKTVSARSISIHDTKVEDNVQDNVLCGENLFATSELY